MLLDDSRAEVVPAAVVSAVAVSAPAPSAEVITADSAADSLTGDGELDSVTLLLSLPDPKSNASLSSWEIGVDWMLNLQIGQVGLAAKVVACAQWLMHSVEGYNHFFGKM